MSVEILQGARRFFGPRVAEDVVPSKTNTSGVVEELVLSFNYDDLPAANANDNLALTIPANSIILSSKLYISEDFDSTSGTSTIAVGTVKTDGTGGDDDGLHADDVTADGSNAGWVVGAGDLVGATVGADPVQIRVEPSADDLEAGSAKLIVEYTPA